MKINDFLSNNKYIFLPSKKKCRVALVVDNKNFASSSFKLYNPFSIKGKLLKVFFKYIVLNSRILKKIFIEEKNIKSKFMDHITTFFDYPLNISLYNSTAKDKVVLQIQKNDGVVAGYLKISINHIGKKRVENEIYAIEKLSEKIDIDLYIFKGEYDGFIFIFLPEILGEIKYINNSQVDFLLARFVRDTEYTLIEHPRVSELNKYLHELSFFKYLEIVKDICDKSNIKYSLVYEHGDFTPWNIASFDNKLVPFDFEYYVEDGLEYFDKFKYYYQIAKLIKKLKGTKLICYVKNNVDIEEFYLIFKLYLINEIIIKKYESSSYDFEDDVLSILERI